MMHATFSYLFTYFIRVPCLFICHTILERVEYYLL
jgi:hypothetical protein